MDQLRVFFTASYYGKKQYQKNYDQVRQAIKNLPVELISPEEGNYLSLLSEEKRNELKDPALVHYEAIREGIHATDCSIIDISYEDFQLGHEATLAIMDKKPVLCVSVHEDFSKKINHTYFFGAKYSSETIGPIVQDFFAKVRELRNAKRFNMFLYPSQSDYLEKAAKRTGMNVSEYVRHLVNLDRRASRIDEE